MEIPGIDYFSKMLSFANAALQTQQLSERPRLKRATPRYVRRRGVRDLTDVTKPGGLEVSAHRSQEATPGLAAGRVVIAATATHEEPVLEAMAAHIKGPGRPGTR